MTSGVIICRPDDRFLRRRIEWCPYEQKNQEMVIRFEEWYAPTLYCCGCGDSWDAEEGLRTRPFARGWRSRYSKSYRRLWDRATYGKPPSLDDLRDGAA